MYDTRLVFYLFPSKISNLAAWRTLQPRHSPLKGFTSALTRFRSLSFSFPIWLYLQRDTICCISAILVRPLRAASPPRPSRPMPSSRCSFVCSRRRALGTRRGPDLGNKYAGSFPSLAGRFESQQPVSICTSRCFTSNMFVSRPPWQRAHRHSPWMDGEMSNSVDRMLPALPFAREAEYISIRG